MKAAALELAAAWIASDRKYRAKNEKMRQARQAGLISLAISPADV
jgi:hypothetical protein